MSIEDDVGLLERVPTFSALGREALRVLAIGAESRTLEGGEVLFRAGDVADCGYVVEEGALTAIPPGRSAQPVRLQRGALIGEMSLIIETRRPATVRAIDPSSVMRIPRPLFLKMLQGYPEVAERLRETLIARADRCADDLGGVRLRLDMIEGPSVELPKAEGATEPGRSG
ncbi:MAG: cyclic nucleotide-binding domain-containing protein [Variibacter sp.]|nr:cyclic nucleotide-binding domain-containing protein [Variibacter sp.]